MAGGEVEGVEQTRGIKRKAEDVLEGPRRIKPLDLDVVNRIAAGEIIVAPVNALKELIENAVDAGATSLEILVKDGGMKLLQITDNGCGIHHDDMAILCERHTTSKLKTFEDLQSMTTYGFRGEALASISHIAHLQITTKTKESSCAWRAHYATGRLTPAKPGQSADPKPCAGRQGTQITVEDMFYNTPTRQRAFRSYNDEYGKILDLVNRYAIHCSGVAFTCKKHGESATGVSVAAHATTVDRIRHVHGSVLANEIIDYECSSPRWGFTSTGWISNANYHVKKLILLLFINHRAVESSAIKKAIEQTYATFLPKGGHPFVYLNLEIEPHRVDVNVHPTKREVNFLNEDEIIEDICEEIRARLAKVDTSRTFMTQSLLPGAKVPTLSSLPSNELPVRSPGRSDGTQTSRVDTLVIPDRVQRASAPKPYENNLVRVDSKSRKITSMLQSLPKLPSLPSGETSVDFDMPGEIQDTEDTMEYEYTDKQPTLIRLASIKELRTSVRDSCHNGLTEAFATHTFVGIVDDRRRIAAIQSGVKLLLVDYGLILNEFLYQLCLTDFGNFGTICLNPPLKLSETLNIAIELEKQEHSQDLSSLDWVKIAAALEEELVARREMLLEYFSIEISEDGYLLSLPLLIKDYTPSLSKLPKFLLRLGSKVNWTQEKECFRSFCRELAAWYAPEAFAPEIEGEGEGEGEGQAASEAAQQLAARRAEVHTAIEHVLFPALKPRLLGTKDMLKGVVEIANLKGLYRVFERC